MPGQTSNMETTHWTLPPESNHPPRPLSRTVSMASSFKSSMSALQHWATRYKKYVTFTAIYLLVVSILLLFMALVLIKWYLMPNLYFWDYNFYAAPYFVLGLGAFKLATSIYGFLICRLQNRILLAILALLLVAAFISQLVTIFFFWNVRTAILLGDISGEEVRGELDKYGRNGKNSKC